VAIPLIRSLRLSPRSVLYALIACLAAVVVVASLVQPVRATATQVWSRAVSGTDLDDSSVQMHLDTVMTMVDVGTFTVYGGLGKLPTLTLRPDGDKQISVTRNAPEDMYRVIAQALGAK